MSKLKLNKSITLFLFISIFCITTQSCKREIQNVDKHLYTKKGERWVLKEHKLELTGENAMEFDLKEFSFELSKKSSIYADNVLSEKAIGEAPALYVPFYFNLSDNKVNTFQFYFERGNQYKSNGFLRFIWKISNTPPNELRREQIITGAISKLNKNEMELYIESVSDTTGYTRSQGSFMRFEKE